MNDIELLKQNILRKIHLSDYPEGHPFLEDSFSNDIIIYVLTMLRLLEQTSKVFQKSEINKGFIDQMIEEKLRSIKNGRFNLESYYQNMSELIILYYLIMGLFDTEHWGKLLRVNNEPRSYFGSENLLEYSLDVLNGEKIISYNIEIKTISCDPFYGNVAIKKDQKLIKRYFHDVNLEDYFTKEQLSKMIILEDNIHYRQISKNLKKIDKKFKKTENSVNIGFVVIQFATSIEEFYSYLYHKEKGIMRKNRFDNTDLFVFFSMTPTPDMKLQEIYDRGHVFSIINDKKIYDDLMIKKFRLDNFIANEEGKIIEELLSLVNKEYGIFRFIVSNDICFFANDDIKEERIQKYASEVSKKLWGH